MRNALSAVECLAMIQVKQQAAQCGVMLLSAATVLREETKLPIMWDLFRNDINVILAEARQALGADAFSTAWAEGQALTLEQAIALASQ